MDAHRMDYRYTVAQGPALSQINADALLVVLTGEPTSFLDAYSTVKELNATYKRQRFDLVVNVVASEAEGKQLFARSAVAGY